MSDKQWHVYLVRCADDSFYCGISNDVDKRILNHNAGRGAKYTATRTPVSLVWSQPCTDRSEASRREYRIKLMNRRGKEKLVAAGGLVS